MKLPTSSSCSTPSPRSSRHPSAPAAMPEPLNRQACKQQVFTGGTGEVSLLFTGRTGTRSACYLQAEQAGGHLQDEALRMALMVRSRCRSRIYPTSANQQNRTRVREFDRRGVSNHGGRVSRAAILRNASLRAAPQDED